MKNSFVSEFDHEVATTRKLLERLPDDEAALAWKPHVKSMSLGGVSTHLANIPTWAGPIFDLKFFDLAGERPTIDEAGLEAARHPASARGGEVEADDQDAHRCSTQYGASSPAVPATPPRRRIPATSCS